ncbi:uncharacterized protein LOC142803269 isoform X2 [Rhipicephalus microplus]
MNAAVVIFGIVTLTVVLSTVDCGANQEKYRKKNEKLIACLEGTDAAAKKERVLKAVNGCKEEGKVKEEMKSCINEKMAFTDEEKKCVEEAEKS